MNNKLKALADAEDIDVSDIARRALREYLDRSEKGLQPNGEPASIRRKKKR